MKNIESLVDDTKKGFEDIGHYTGLVPTDNNEGGIYKQVVAMFTGDQRRLQVSVDNKTKEKIATEVANAGQEKLELFYS